MSTLLFRLSVVAFAAAFGPALVMAGAPAQEPAGMTMDVCPTNYGSFPEDAPPLTCGCTAAAAEEGSVRGANPYYYQSSLCRAALHAGAIGAQGGTIKVTPAPQPFFPAVAQNGVESDSWTEGMGFAVEVPAAPSGSSVAAAGAPDPAPSGAADPAAPGMTLDVCPTNYGVFPEDAPPLTCGCTAASAEEGTVRGVNPYYYQSSLCRAALHAGAIAADGGTIVVAPSPQPFYPAVMQNGVESDSWTQGMGFSIGRAGAGAAAGSPAVVPTPGAVQASGMSMDACPIHYGDFPQDAPTLSCGCTAAASAEGTVRGANPYYYYQSSLCRAGVHAGAIGADGGKITVTPSPQPFFPAVSQNGVDSDSWNEGMGFAIAVEAKAAVAEARPQVDAAGLPVQAPIAETLRATGSVQLYVNFATDRDTPLATSEPVLAELLATLQDDPALRVELIGHTDDQGNASYNLDLSQRRAAAVYLWLIQHGVDSARLRSDGHGLAEPIADNATDAGRALNRRVEVRAVN